MIEDKLRLFMRSQRMYSPGDRILAAVSGGKDSALLAHILSHVKKKDNTDVTLLYIDLGIGEYSKQSRKTVEELAETVDIPLTIFSVPDEWGGGIEHIARTLRKKPCYVCGIIKRHAMAEVGRNYSSIATGHNLDDVLAFYLNNVITGRTSFSSTLRPVSPGSPKKIRPLFYLTEKQVARHVLELGLPVFWGHCPLSAGAFTITIKHALNTLEAQKPGSKKNLLKFFLSLPAKEETTRTCVSCGLPAMGQKCAYCRLKEKFVNT